MRVARHRPVGVALGEVGERAHQLAAAPARASALLAHEQRHVGRDLVVARPRGVELAADRAGDLGQPALDRHVDVLVAGLEVEACPRSSSPRDRVEARGSSSSASAGSRMPASASIATWALDWRTS